MEHLRTSVMLHPRLVTPVANDKTMPIRAIKHYASQFGTQLNIDNDNKDIITNVANWCFRIKQPEANLNPGLGLWFYGNIGTGKSLLMDVVMRFIHENWILSEDECMVGENYGSIRTPDPHIIGASKLCLDFAKSGYGILDPMPRGIDELGTEPEITKYMGTSLNVMRFLFEEMPKGMRGGAFQYVPQIVTTNLSFGQILDRYGERTVDRIGEMFNIVEFRGASYRKSGHLWEAIKREK